MMNRTTSIISLLRRGIALGALTAGIASPAFALDDTALPSGGQVTGGSASFDYSSPDQLHVYQSSDRAVIDWSSFNIGQNALTEFHQPGANSIVVNRVTGNGDPTQILGSLRANGIVMVLDRNGVIFGANSRVDVGGIIASTGSINESAFMAGGNVHLSDIDTGGSIINHGTISVADAGLAAFVAPTVVNSGIIEARLGMVALAAGERATLDLYGDGLLELAVDKDTMSGLVANHGVIAAAGGSVVMTASAAKKVVDNIVMNTGIISATGASVDKAGRIILYAEGTNAVPGNASEGKLAKTGASIAYNSGVLDAGGPEAGQGGGTIAVLGDNVILDAGSLIGTSGDAGGGDIRIGGDYLGTGDTPTAMYTYVDRDAYLFNDAYTQGSGGRTIVWSDHTTDFFGSIFARGGTEGGNGGFLETSGKVNLLPDGYADLTNRVDGYSKGSYLLDPQTITIYGNVDPTFQSTDGSIDLAASLQLWLDGNDIDGDGTAEGLGEAGLMSGIANCGTNVTCVSQWNDKSGHNRNATQSLVSSRPTFILGGQNGADVISFDGVVGGDYLTISNFTLPSASSFFIAAQSRVQTTDAGSALRPLISNRDTANNGKAVGAPRADSSPSDELRAYWLGGAITGSGAGTWPIGTAKLIYAYLNDAGGANNLSLGLNGKSSSFSNQPTTISTSNTTDIGGEGANAARRFNGNIFEEIVYDRLLTANDHALLSQYQSAKWGLALDKLAGAGSEIAESTAHNSANPTDTATNGYNVFTTRYLERLAGTADLILQASNSITLDLKGDTLNLAGGSAAGKSITLKTDNGNITDLSVGTLRTTRTGTGAGQTGNISIIAGGTGSINLDTTNLEALNGGVVNMSAGGSINLVQSSALNLGLAQSNGNVSIKTNSTNITGAGGIVTNGGAINVEAGNDLDLRTFGLRSGGGNITLKAARDALLSTSINAGSGFISVTASRDITISPHNLSSGLVGQWAFDDGSGSVANDSAGNNDGTLVGNTAWSTDDPYGLINGYSLDFDGTGDYVSVPGPNLSSPWTISFWVKLRDYSNTYPNFFSASGGIDLGLGTTSTQSFYSNGIYFTASPVALNTWVERTYIASGGMLSLYENGKFIESKIYTPSNFNSFKIGAYHTAAYGANALIDDVRIYNTALSSGDVAQLYASSPQWNAGSVVMEAGRDVTLNGGISATGAGNAMTIAAGRNFINNARPTALATSNINARWLVYSSDPAANTLGGLSPAFKRYNKTYAGYAPASVTESGNGLLYSIAPVLAVTAQDTARAYGDVTSFTYSINTTGLIDGDTLGTAVSGTPTLSSAATAMSDAGTTHAITAAPGTLASDLGYQFSYAPGVLTIGKRDITAVVHDGTRAYGAANPAWDWTHVMWNNLAGSQDGSVLDTLLVGSAADTTSEGSSTITIMGFNDNNYRLIGQTPGRLIIGAKPILMPLDIVRIVNAKLSATSSTVPSSEVYLVASDDVSDSTAVTASGCLAMMQGGACVLH